MARRLLMVEVSGGLVWGRLRLGLMDGVKMALGSRGKTVEVKDWKEWRAPWCICRILSFRQIFFLGFLSDCPPMLWWPLHDAVGVDSKKITTSENQCTGAWYMG